MKQAKVPTEAEFKRLLAVVQQGRHSARNRLAVMLSYYDGATCRIARAREFRAHRV